MASQVFLKTGRAVGSSVEPVGLELLPGVATDGVPVDGMEVDVVSVSVGTAVVGPLVGVPPHEVVGMKM